MPAMVRGRWTPSRRCSTPPPSSSTWPALWSSCLGRRCTLCASLPHRPSCRRSSWSRWRRSFERPSNPRLMSHQSRGPLNPSSSRARLLIVQAPCHLQAAVISLLAWGGPVAASLRGARLQSLQQPSVSCWLPRGCRVPPHHRDLRLRHRSSRCRCSRLSSEGRGGFRRGRPRSMQPGRAAALQEAPPLRRGPLAGHSRQSTTPSAIWGSWTKTG
mmetsp:Transcript_1403/g.4183  ORF Transcript_1403/g.4183 Transcript_1403/m.4183 type:complete len:215 (+) Transcript_1403:956-1600(+)